MHGQQHEEGIVYGNEEKAADELFNCLVDVVAIVNNDYERVLSSIE